MINSDGPVTQYHIAVKLETQGAGGSLFMHGLQAAVQRTALGFFLAEWQAPCDADCRRHRYYAYFVYGPHAGCMTQYFDGSDPSNGLSLAQALGAPLPDRYVYVRGPQPLIDALIAVVKE